MTLTQNKLNRVMNMSIAFGSMGSAWFILSSPQAIFNVFIKNHLHASSSMLGIIVAIVQLSGIFQLASIFIYGSLPRIKGFWLSMHTAHRLFGLILAGVSLYSAFGGERNLSLSIILVTISVSWVLMNISASGWWSWFADLIPENLRGSFFLRRSAIVNVVNIIWFFTVTLLLDAFAESNIFIVYAVVFTIGGIVGILDIVLHGLIPEPRKQEEREPIGQAEFFEPLKSRNFLGFAFAIGLATFSINIIVPFTAPYITDPETVGAENTWLGIMYVISQLMWIVAASPWGVFMDRYGRKPVVLLGLLFTTSWIGYLFLTPDNYVYILPLVSLVGGMLSPAFWEGSNQMMLTLTPQKNRIAFVAWYMTIVGVVSSGGSLLGGVLSDTLAPVKVPFGGVTFGSFHIVLLLSLALVALSILVLAKVREGKEKPVGYVVSRITNPGIFRTFLNMGIIGRTPDSSRVARALRAIEGEGDDIALEEVLARLDDPHPDVREESARALGRIGSPEAVNALIERLADPHSTIRTHAARALGRIGESRAIPHLIEGLSSSSEDLQEACAQALGEIGGTESAGQLLKLIQELKSDRVLASGAEAAARLGLLDAAWEIIPRMHRTANPILRNQLAYALGNLLGPQGKFYQYISGNPSQREMRIQRLFLDALRNTTRIIRKFRELHHIRSTIPGFPHRQTEILRLLRKIREHMEMRQPEEAVQLLHMLAKLFISLLLGREITDEEEYLDNTFLFDPKLGLWWWFIQEAMKALPLPDSRDVLEIDVFLGVFFLRNYMYFEEEEEEAERVREVSRR